MSTVSFLSDLNTPGKGRWRPGWKVGVGVSLMIYTVITYLVLSGVDDPVRFRFDMSPLAESSLPLQIHVASAISTFLVGLYLLSGLPKGTKTHRRIGWLWVTTMAITAVSSFFLVGLNGNTYSWIHGLSAWTVIMLPFGVVAARRHNVKSHASNMRGMFLGGMLIAGLFSFLPGRMMWHLFFTV